MATSAELDDVAIRCHSTTRSPKSRASASARRRRGAARLQVVSLGAQALWMPTRRRGRPPLSPPSSAPCSPSPPPPTTMATACPTSSAATTYRSPPTRCCRPSSSAASAARRRRGSPTHRAGWARINARLAGLTAGGAALATLHAPYYASALLGPAASTATALATALVGAVCVAEGSAAFWRRHGACVAPRGVPGARAVGRAARGLRDARRPTCWTTISM